jgi:hypothetical protein
MSPAREKLSKLRDVIIKRKDMLKRSGKAKEESDGEDESANTTANDYQSSPIIGEARDTVTTTLAMSRSTIVASRVDPTIAPEPQRARATSKPTPPLPPPRRVLSSDNEAPSRPTIPPLPLLLRTHPAWLDRESKAKSVSDASGTVGVSSRRERPPVPPFPGHLQSATGHNNNNKNVDSASECSAEETASIEAITAIPTSPPPPARPPRPTRLHATGKQRSYYPTSHFDRQTEVYEQLARWNQFYDSASRKVRDSSEDDDADQDDLVSSPGAPAQTSPKPRPPVPARNTAKVPSPLSCPAVIQSSSSPTGSGLHSLRCGTFGPIDPARIAAEAAHSQPDESETRDP